MLKYPYIYVCHLGINYWKEQKMVVFEYILLAILFVCALIIVAAVVLQKSNEGLSGTIAGGNDTYYNKDKSADLGKKLFKITMIACIVFAVAVLAAYILQPDYYYVEGNDWKEIVSEAYSSLFDKSKN